MSDLESMIRTLRYSYNRQRTKARHRRVAFQMSFGEWLGVWADSGKLSMRGRRRGCYVMARPNDVGAYRVGNVRIIKVGDNLREAHYGVPRPKEAIAKMRRAKLGKSRPIFSKEWRDNIAKGQRARRAREAACRI